MGRDQHAQLSPHGPAPDILATNCRVKRAWYSITMGGQLYRGSYSQPGTLPALTDEIITTSTP